MVCGILIAGTHSGAGKTIVSLGIAEFLKKFFRVVPFKVGPDYIDPGYHRMVCEEGGYNLDLFLLGKERLENLFRSRAQKGDFALVEGVMGLYDGLGEGSWGSSAHLAKILSLPVVLVVDARGMAGSVSALVKGFRDFDPEVPFGGVFLNRVRSPRHFSLLQKCIERDTGLPVLGFLPDNPEFTIPERNLGLVSAGEAKDSEQISRIGEAVSARIDGERLVQIASEIKPLSEGASDKKVLTRIGIGLDQVFHFYYRSSLEYFQEEGVEFVPFSPLEDKDLPSGISGIYLGGGFPEAFVSELSGNRRIQERIRDSVFQGMPVYAECGGLMYLSRGIEVEDKFFPMAKVFDFTVGMTSYPKHFGYAEAEVYKENLIARKGTILRGHEFHYSQILDENGETTYRVRKPGGKEYWRCGFMRENVLATYLHIDFFAFPEVARRLVKKCLLFERRRKK